MSATSERFFAKVKSTEPHQCWLWTAATRNGYGWFRSDTGKNTGAHRWSYEYHVGPIPEGLVIDHLCRVRHCVNPAHLEPVTPLENTRRGFSPSQLHRVKTHCYQGHPFSPSNTFISSEGWRVCLTCRRASDRIRQRRRRAAA